MEDWYNVTTDDFERNGGGNMLSKYPIRLHQHLPANSHTCYQIDSEADMDGQQPIPL